MISVRNLHKSFGDQHVLRGIDVDLKPGKCNLIIGLSGSGKTVMLKSILGLVQPDEGTILYDGRNLREMEHSDARKVRQEMGMVFQGSA